MIFHLNKLCPALCSLVFVKKGSMIFHLNKLCPALCSLVFVKKSRRTFRTAAQGISGQWILLISLR